MKYLDRLATLKRGNVPKESSIQHRIIYITPHCPNLTEDLKDKLLKLDEQKVLVDIGLTKIYDVHDYDPSIAATTSFMLYLRQLFYANLNQIDFYPVCIERFFKQILTHINAPILGLNQISIKFGYGDYSQGLNGSNSQNALYNPVEHGDYTILSISCSINPSILNDPKVDQCYICKCHKAKTIDHVSGLLGEKKHYCSVGGVLSEKDIFNNSLSLGQQIVSCKMNEKKKLSVHLDVIKRVPIQSQNEATLFGNTYILTSQAEYNVMDWDTAKRNKQLFYGLCHSLLQRMEVLITKTNIDISTNTVSEINRFYVLTPSTSGNALLLQSIASSDQVLPYNIDSSFENDITPSMSIIDAALSQIPCQEFNPFEYESGYHKLCEEYVSKVLQPHTPEKEIHVKKDAKRTMLTITSTGVIYTE